MEPTEASLQAMRILRDPSLFRWYVIPLVAFVVYVYAVEIEKRNWSAVYAGLTYYFLDILWEILNAVLLRVTNHSGLWIVSGGTSFLIFAGLSIEISMMFAVAGVVFTKFLPKDKRLKILGIPNRWFFIVVFSTFCAFVEWLLVHTPYFHWGYSWWNFPLVALIGYAPFDYACFKVFDAPRKTQVRVVAGLVALDLVLLIVFNCALHWV
jgi:hypothetical protein